MPTPDSHNPFLELMDATSKIDPGALVTLWANLPPHPPGFTGDLFERFDDIDGDGDGFISRDELDWACASPDFHSNQAAALAALRTVLDDIESLSDDEVAMENDGITRADLAGLDLAKHANAEDPLVEQVELYYKYAKRKIARSPRKVFTDESAPSIDPLTCRQGLMGDCFFLAPLMSLALQTPSRLLSMIRRHPDRADAWRIYFRGADDAITVEAPTDAEIALFASADGLWPIIFEKAYGIYALGQVYAMLRSTELDASNGGRPSHAIKALTGNEVDADVLSSTRLSTTRAKLIEAFDNQKVVVAGIGGIEDITPKTTKDGLRRSHAYSVISFDAATDMVYVRNPWGTDKGGFADAEISQGCFEIPLAALDANFSELHYEL